MSSNRKCGRRASGGSASTSAVVVVPLTLPVVEKLELRRLLASGPIVITKGGTYSGSWENLDDRTPVITVDTTQPVVIENSTLRGKGHLVFSDRSGADITIRNTSGFGVNPDEYGQAPGRFLTTENAQRLVVQDNYLEGTAGIHVLGYAGDHTAAESIRVVGNRAKNIDGRKSDGNGGWLDFNERKHTKTGKEERGYEYAQFLQFDKVRSVPGIQIAWNEVVNEVGKSRVEDVISIYKSSGTPSSPIKIHDNYIDGAYTLRPWQANYANGNWKYDWSYSGGGIMVGDGHGSGKSGDPAYVNAFGNTVIGTTNHGIATSSGRHTKVYANRIFSSGRLPDGRWNLQQNVGLYVWDSYDLGSSRFYDNRAYGNTVGWMKSGGERNDWWTPHDSVSLKDNLRAADPITRQTELNEAAAWRARRYPPPTTGTIAGTIYRDINRNGTRQASREKGVTGFIAWLDLDHDGVRDAREPASRSSSTGRYRFPDLAPGKYTVRVEPKPGWSVTSAPSATLRVAGGQTATRYFGVR